MNEISTSSYGDVFAPNIKTTKNVIITPVPEIGTLWYNCLAIPPKIEICKDIIEYKDIEKTKEVTKYCSALKKILRMC